MKPDPYPNLLFPSCAQCAGIGLPSIPPLLWDMEDACGEEVMKAMLLEYGGLEVDVGKARDLPFDRDPLQIGRAWLAKHRGPGKIVLPKGPATRSARVAWTAYNLLKDGASLSQVARLTDNDLRTVCNIKRKLRACGALPAKARRK